MLNVALAEEGPGSVLLALCRSSALGPEAIDVIAARIEREGAAVGRELEVPEAGQPPLDQELDRLLIAHPRAPDSVRDTVLARHANDPYFVLAAAVHPTATLGAIEAAIDWPATSLAHDRLWLALLDPSIVPPLSIDEWSQDASALRREAAARIASDPAILQALSLDRSRRVRRAVASNRFAGELRARLAASDSAVDVRARARGAMSHEGEDGARSQRGSVLETAKFAAALRAMETGGVLVPDVVRALSGPVLEIDDEGASIAAIVLSRAELGALVDGAIEATAPCSASLAAGLALRPVIALGAEDEDETEHTEIVYDAVKSLARTTTATSRLTGKARLAAWTAEGLARSQAIDRADLPSRLSARPLAAARVVLARAIALDNELIRTVVRGFIASRATGIESVAAPPAVVELAWLDRSVSDADAIAIAARSAKPKNRAEDLPDDEVDFDPAARGLDVLERAVLATVLRANVSPRAALSVVALDARRVRYVLAAMPQWKGRLSGGKLARVLRQNAGAISAGAQEARARGSKIEGWTERVMSEVELSIALAVGHVTGAEVARRAQSGRQNIEDGITLAAGAEARASLEGPESVAPLVAWGAANRMKSAGAFGLWLLLERLDRGGNERAASLVASNVDSLASTPGPLSPSLVDALALIEHRRPGRLEEIHAQAPRGRAAIASAIARAYRALGGLRDERSGDFAGPR